MPRCGNITPKCDHLAYRDPTPETVHKLLSSGSAVVHLVERWHWLSEAAIHKIGQAGRELSRASTPAERSRLKRTLTLAEEEAAGALAIKLGSSHRAALKLGYSETLINTFLRERGLPLPKLTNEQRSAPARKFTDEDLVRCAEAGMTSPQAAQHLGVSRNQVRLRAGKLGVSLAASNRGRRYNRQEPSHG